MTKRLTTQQLEAIRKRVVAATAGPWIPFYGYDGEAVVVAPTNEHGEIATDMYDNDAEFIAHASEDIPALLAEVERLREKNEDMRIKVEVTDESAESIIAENERLQNALSEIADIADWDYGLEHAKDITFKAIGEPKGWDGKSEGIDEALGEHYGDIAKEAEAMANEAL